VDTPEAGKVGEYSYRYPRLVAEVVHLWPERVEDYPSYYDPFWYPHPYWGYWPYGHYRPWWW
jgi:outer membrane lipoprotein